MLKSLSCIKVKLVNAPHFFFLLLLAKYSFETKFSDVLLEQKNPKYCFAGFVGIFLCELLALEGRVLNCFLSDNIPST